jgi:hypothetical protein
VGNFVTGTRLTATHLGTLAGCRAMARHFHATPQARASGGRPSCRSHRLVHTQIPLPKSPFEVTAVDAGTSWAWRGDILWLTLDFNHVVEPEGDGTRITFDLNLNGRGAALVRRLGRILYGRQMRRALDLLVEQAERDS